MRTIVTLLFIACVTSPFACAQKIICVNGSTAPLGPVCDDVRPNLQGIPCREAINEAITGIDCWDNAYIDLQDALDEAAALANQGSSVEVWVAAGTYKPDRGTGDRHLSFELHKNVELYGGFSGWETFRDQRDFVNNETILSGDLSDDDNPNGTNDGGASNCCIEHDSPGCDDADCMAKICDNVRPPRCCTTGYWNCYALAKLLCCDLCSTRNNCENSFHVVVSEQVDGPSLLDGFTVMRGRSDIPSRYTKEGSGIMINGGSATIRNCQVRENAGSHGSAIRALKTNLTVSNCILSDNEGVFNTGSTLIYSDSDLWLEKTHIVRNSTKGIATFSFSSSLICHECVISDNKHVGADISGYAKFVDSLFLRNQGQSAGAIELRFGSAILERTLFIENQSLIGAGAIHVFIASLVLDSCLVVGNHGPNAGGLYLRETVASIVNSTIASNNSLGIAAQDTDNIVIVNSVLWNNRDSLGDITQRGQIGLLRSSALVDYTAIQDWDGQFGNVGNTGDDPMFVDIDGPDDIPGNEDDDLRLRPDSPLIDAGDPDATLSIDRDLDGHTRILCDRVDMGPYEFGIGDFDCNGLVNLSDLADWPTCMTAPGATSTTTPCTAFDFNADGAVDLSDYAALQAIISAP